MITPQPFNHVGIGVPDIHAAVTWYRDVLGCIVLVEPGTVSDDGTHFGELCKDIFGESWRSMQMAHLTTADGLGLELFQFEVPEQSVPNNTYEYWRAGIFHICLTAPDIEEVRERIVQSGGKALSKVWTFYSNKPYKTTYCQDPWGTVIELNSHSYSQVWSNLETPVPFSD